jgi:hypothetical protein
MARRKIAECNVDGRAVINGPSTELEKLHSGLGGTGGKKFGQRCRQFVIYDVSSSGTIDAKQRVGTFHVDTEECIEHGGDQDGTAEVRRCPKRGTQPAFPSARLAELDGQVDQRVHATDLVGWSLPELSPAIGLSSV